MQLLDGSMLITAAYWRDLIRYLRAQQRRSKRRNASIAQVRSATRARSRIPLLPNSDLRPRPRIR